MSTARGGTERVLREHRERLRREVRAELAEAGAEFEAARVRRDHLIRRMGAWGESLRSIAGDARVGHVQVRNILHRPH
ncbi:hypothetical protein ACTG9Q_24730 [Actinokineospora sp. 24-640]